MAFFSTRNLLGLIWDFPSSQPKTTPSVCLVTFPCSIVLEEVILFRTEHANGGGGQRLTVIAAYFAGRLAVLQLEFSQKALCACFLARVPE